MNRYEEKIMEYIQDNLSKGFSKEAIKDELVQSGYDGNYINSLFYQLETPNPMPQKRLLGRVFGRKIAFVNELNKPKPRFDAIKLEKEHPNPIMVENKLEPFKAKGISEKIDELGEKIDAITQTKLSKEYRHFKLPSKIRRDLKKLGKKNKVMVILLKRNRSAQPLITDIKDGFVAINGIPHNCSMDFMFLWKDKYPCIVVPEWDLNPIGTEDYYKAVANKRVADPIAVAIRMIENKEKLMKTSGFGGLSATVWVIIVLVVIAVIYVLSGGIK